MSPATRLQVKQLGLGGPSDALRPSAMRAAAEMLRGRGRELEAVAEALRAAHAADEAAAGEEGAATADAASLEAVARRCAGVPLSHPHRLRSAYGLHAQPTHANGNYLNALDWIMYDEAQLALRGVAPIPPVEALLADGAMPSAEWPSDHCALCCDLEFTPRRSRAAGGPGLE